MATILGRLITSRWAVRHPLTPASVSSFGWSAVSPPRPEDRQRAARSGGQDWPQATVRREAVLTAASTARASIRSESPVAQAAVEHRYTVRTRNNARRGVTAPLSSFLPWLLVGSPVSGHSQWRQTAIQHSLGFTPVVGPCPARGQCQVPGGYGRILPGRRAGDPPSSRAVPLGLPP